MNHDGKLTKEEFAVAMYLIRGKLAGKEIPNELPPSLVPPPNLPDLNATPVATTAPQQQEPLRASTPPPPYDENLNVPDENA